MKKSALFLSIAVSLGLFGFVGYFASSGSGVYAQHSERQAIVAGATTPIAGERAPLESSTAFTAAARRNAQLQKSLSWVFGGKQQTGWGIYAPLLAHTIAVDADANSPEFAAALAKWQERNSLEPTGVLETETLQALVRFWQAQRLGRMLPRGS